MKSMTAITAIILVLLLSSGSVLANVTQSSASGASSSVRINEVMYNPLSPEVDGEWIEIYNNGTEAVNVTGWIVTDQDGSDDFVFPAMAMPPDSFVVIHAGAGNNSTDFSDGAAHFYLFKSRAFLGNSGDDICLMNGSEVMDYMAYGNSTSIDMSPDHREFSPLPQVEENRTLGILNGTWEECVPTPGAPNTDAFCTPDEQEANITEEENTVNVNNESNETTPGENYTCAPILITDVYYYSLLSEAFTIYNPTDEDVFLAGWSFSDGEGTVFFPENSSIPPMSSLTLAQDSEGYFEESGVLADMEWSEMEHSGTFRMNNDGDELLLYSPFGHVVDAFVYGDSAYNGTGWTGEPATRLHSTEVAHRTFLNGSYMDTNSSADWNDTATGIGRSSFPPFTASGKMNITAFSAPDNSYEVVSEAIDSASTSILVNVYEFTSYSLSQHLIDAEKRGVNITMLLEGGPVGGIPEEEISLCQSMHSAGIDIRFMVNDYAEKINDRYRFDHAKYMVIDGSRLIIMSENMGADGFSPAHTGNRGWGLVIDNTEMAGYFLSAFENDSNPSMRDIASIEDMPFYSSYIGSFPDAHGSRPLRAPKTFYGNATLTAVLSPDTSLSDRTILGMIDSAEESVYVEQFYIYKHWGSSRTGSVYANPNPYLEAVVDAARRGCEVRIIMDNSWYNTDPNSSVDNDDTLEYVNGIAEEEGLNMQAKLISECHNFTHLHNKGVIVDNRSVLVSSINWNENSVKENREAGIIVESEEVASYFVSLFESDWISEPALNVSLGADLVVRANESVLLSPTISVSNTSIAEVVWNIDGREHCADELNTNFPTAGTYDISVTVRDIYNRTASSSVSVVVLPAITPSEEGGVGAKNTSAPEEMPKGLDTGERGIHTGFISVVSFALAVVLAILVLISMRSPKPAEIDKGGKRENKEKKERVPQHS